MGYGFQDFVSSSHLLVEERAVHPLLLEALSAQKVVRPGSAHGELVSLAELTTREVVELFIQPWTAECGGNVSAVEALHTGAIRLPEHPMSQEAAIGSSYISVDGLDQSYKCWHDSGDGGKLVGSVPGIMEDVPAPHSPLRSQSSSINGEPQQRRPSCSADDTPPMFFVSHAWDSKFGDLVRAVLSHHEAEMWSQLDSQAAARFKAATYLSHKRDEWYCICQVRTYYWLDFLAVGQNQGIQPLEHVEESVQDVMANSRALLLCATPSLEQPLAMQRLWCLYELMVATELKKPIQLLTSRVKTFQDSDSIQQAVQLFEQLDSGALSEADLATADTTSPSDRDMLFRLIHSGSHHRTHASTAKEVLQARLRAAAADYCFQLLLLSRFPADAVARCRKLADDQARYDASNIATDLDLFQLALSSHSNSSGSRGLLASVQRSTRPPVMQASTDPPCRRTPSADTQLYSTSPQASGSKGNLIELPKLPSGSNSRTHDTVNLLDTSEHGGTVNQAGASKVVLEVPGHLDHPTARLLREARLAHPANAYVPLKIGCHCASCMKIIAEGGKQKARTASLPRPAPQATNAPLERSVAVSPFQALFPSYGASSGTCTTSGFPVVALKLHQAEDPDRTSLGRASSTGAASVKRGHSFRRRSGTAVSLRASNSGGMGCAEFSPRVVDRAGSQPSASRLVPTGSGIGSAYQSPRTSYGGGRQSSGGGALAPSMDVLLRRSQMGGMSSQRNSNSGLPGAGPVDVISHYMLSLKDPLTSSRSAGPMEMQPMLDGLQYEEDDLTLQERGRALSASRHAPAGGVQLPTQGRMSGSGAAGSGRLPVRSNGISMSGTTTSARFEDLIALPTLATAKDANDLRATALPPTSSDTTQAHKTGSVNRRVSFRALSGGASAGLRFALGMTTASTGPAAGEALAKIQASPPLVARQPSDRPNRQASALAGLTVSTDLANAGGTKRSSATAQSVERMLFRSSQSGR